jgi:hypothetical protein
MLPIKAILVMALAAWIFVLDMIVEKNKEYRRVVVTFPEGHKEEVTVWKLDRKEKRASR